MLFPANVRSALDILKLNNINVHRIQKDTIMEVESYKIESYQKLQSHLTKGHYAHYNTKVSLEINSKELL